MKNISLNIDKALGTVSKEQVYAQEANSKVPYYPYARRRDKGYA